MYTSKSGKKFGSAFAGRKHDEMHSEPESDKSKMSHMVEEPKEDAMESKTEGEQEMHPAVAEHGPAEEVHITHDHEGHRHHVTSKHKDGHMNESDHETPEEAHEVGGKLANISLKKSGEAEDQQLAESEGGNSHAPDGFEMPDLA